MENDASAAEHASEDISHTCCLDMSGFLNTLKKQESFL